MRKLRVHPTGSPHPTTRRRVSAGAATFAVVASLVTLGLPAHAAPGDLDPTFGVAGTQTTPLGTSAAAYGVALQPDGKIVAAGTTDRDPARQFALARYNPDGTPDTSFATSGWRLGSRAEARGMVVQPDGKIVAAGYADVDGTRQFALGRLLPNGSVDTSFGDRGSQTTLIGTAADASAVALQPDGKIVAAGATDMDGARQFALARYNPDGTPDTSFLTSGWRLGTGAEARGVVVQPDGKIVAAGYDDVGGTRQFALGRLLPNGSVDTSFGNSGSQTTPLGTSSAASAVVLQPDGKIVAAGTTDRDGAVQFALARYNPDGSPDTSFATSGWKFGTLAEARGVVVQPDGKIVVAGYADVDGTRQFALGRLLPNGSVDTSFGDRGSQTTLIGTAADAYGVVLQPDGKIVAAGAADVDGTRQFALARYGVTAAPTVSTAPPTDPAVQGTNVTRSPQATGTLPRTGASAGPALAGLAMTVIGVVLRRTRPARRKRS